MQGGLVKANARIDLLDGADGGLTEPMPSPCQSLLLRVELDADEEPVDLGVRITTLSGEPISPGTSGVAVDLDFWSDLADVFVVPSTRFTLRYPSRVVGVGQVLDVLPFETH
jgi:hypothetical protein